MIIQRFKKPIVYLLMTMLVMPAYLWMSLTSATVVRAAAASQLNEGFDAGLSTAGWTFSGVSTYAGAADSGFSSPSIKFDTNGDLITSPVFANGDILSFWVRGKGDMTGSSLSVEYLPSGGVWTALTTLSPIPTSGTTKNYTLSSHPTQLRFSYNKADSGNLALDDIAVTYADATAPSIPSQISPANNSYTVGGWQNFSWEPSTDPDDTSFNYYVRINGNNTYGPVNVTNLDINLGVYPQGPLTWEAGASDGTNTSWSTIRTLIKDNTVPTIDSISGNAGTTGEETLISVNAHDNGLIDKVEMNVNGGTYFGMAGLVSPYTYDFPIPSDSTDSVNYTIKVTDKAGNITTSAIQTISVTDNDAPVINSVSSSPDTTGEVSTVSINASDNIGITSAMININGAGYVPLLGSEPNYSYAYTLPVNSVLPVYYTIKFTDLASHITESPIYAMFPFDDDEPVISSVTGNTGTTGEPTTVSVVASDNIGVTAGQISINGGTWINMTGMTYDVSVPVDSIATINYSVRVRDVVGNWSDEVARSITVTDNDKPTIPSILIESGDVYTNSSAVNLTLNADDNIAVTQMRFRNGNAGSWSPWEAYSTSKVWNLLPGDGSKLVQVKFRDAALNVSSLASDTIILDMANPTATVDDLLTNLPTPTLTGTASDGYALDSVVVTVNSHSYPATVTGSSWSVDIAEALVDGIYDVVVVATDKAGNTGADTSLGELTVDLTSPDMPVANPIAGEYPATQNVQISSNDNHSDLAHISIYYSLDGTNPDNITGIEYTAPILINADANLKAIAYDEAGNASDIMTAVYGIAPVISNQSSVSIATTSATITWTTDHSATSRVVYDTVSHATLGSASNYGYAYSTIEFDSVVKVKNHSVFISGLTPGVTYYFRAISHGSPESVGAEMSFVTTAEPVVTTAATDTLAPSAATANVKPSTAQAADNATKPNDDQGQIKGDEDATNTEEENGVNWTPWIILFILLILAGAATGGYFYWFAGEDDDEDEKPKSEPKVKAAAPAKSVKKTATKTSNNKKAKRW